MLKVLTLVGTRPEIIKLSCVIGELDRYTDQILVHSGQNSHPGLNQIFFDELGVRAPDRFLNAAGDTPAETIGRVIAMLDRVLAEVRPDALLILGDTNTALGAIAAKRRKIPIFHMEAGNRCFDDRVPEEINRRMVDHISDVNLTYTEHARRYLLAEGLRPDLVIKTGSPMKEILERHNTSIAQSTVQSRLSLTIGGYFLVSAHREENVDSEEHLTDLLNTLQEMRHCYHVPIIVSTHPRTRMRLQAAGVLSSPGGIEFHDPFGFFDYVNLQMHAACVLSDSGTITEECAILGFPAVMLRHAHERPEGMDEGVLIMCGMKAPQVLEAVKVTMAQSKNFKPRMPTDYDAAAVSTKVVRIILSYRDYVERIVWRRY
jgi:UDP-N-acetylglucosamine 2-epimerase (non-hydrolysing)